ncbi:MAG: DUF4097 family beta strand repeat protein [Chloroflexi bacterium]|uniref:DUF4097 family beta strand repeat protein n=1 Tax=Candidatus Chlorohelix allophototropha TaxID=3003348 RepID=A0A8T7MAY0_9CHLR|nr:DUF4097 family beta strand repeat protein [Chloroflexota bacterium]WJW66131.1 hypothetical protein OZ401_001920 [Chloroflexota bacterium L227-S17]
MNKRIGFLVILVLFSSWIFVACGDDTTQELSIGTLQTESIISNDSKAISLDIAGGEIQLQGNSDTGLMGQLDYNIPQLKPQTDGIGSPSLKIHQNISGSKLPSNGLVNRWNLQFGGKEGLDFSAAIGNGSVIANTGNAQLSNFYAKVLNGSVDLNLEQPQTSLKQLSVEVGTGSISMKGLANTNSPAMNIKVGSGKITLDFSTGLNATYYAVAGVGNGDITFVVPSGLGIKVTATITTGNFSAPGFNRIGNQTIYTNAEYAKGGNVLNLDLRVSNGNIKALIK